jgi:hypothetical protein
MPTGDTQPTRPVQVPEQRPARRIVVRRTSEDAMSNDQPAYNIPPSSPSATTSGGRGGCFWVFMTLGLILGAIVIVLSVLLIGGFTTINGLTGGISQALNPAPQASVNTSQTIINSITPLGELVTVNAQLAKADLNVNIQQGVLNACSFNTSYVAQASIDAGVDLLQTGPEDLRYDELTDTYTITLPAPRVLGCSIDYIDQYNQSVTLCNVDWDSARQIGQYVALQQFQTDALEGGLLDRAQRQAELVITNFVSSLTGSRVVVQFAAPEGEPVLPPSCRPQLPQGWNYDPTTQTWTQSQ